MSLVSALVMAAPLYGLSLIPQLPLPAPPGSILRLPFFAQVGEGEDAQPQQAQPAVQEAPQVEEAPATPAVPTAQEAAAAAEQPATPPAASSTSAEEMRAYAEQLRHRQEIASIHRIFGISTWASMLVTEVLGAFQYYNLYGFFASRESTPCVAGGAIFGQDQCWGTPWAHRISAVVTTALYGTAFTLSLLMPDPDHAENGSSAYAEHLRIHKVLRWVHFAGMLAQIFLGLAIGENWFGLDRANNFGALQALATVHEGIGLITFGALTAAGAIMLF